VAFEYPDLTFPPAANIKAALRLGEVVASTTARTSVEVHRANLRSQRGRVARASWSASHETKLSRLVTLTAPTQTAGGASPRARIFRRPSREIWQISVMFEALNIRFAESIRSPKMKNPETTNDPCGSMILSGAVLATGFISN
jgi:hypothetical protein